MHPPHHNNIKQLSDSKSIFEFIFFPYHSCRRFTSIYYIINIYRTTYECIEIYPCWHCQSNNYRDVAIFT